MNIHELELPLTEEDLDFLDNLIENDNKALARLIEIFHDLNPDQMQELHNFADQAYEG